MKIGYLEIALRMDEYYNMQIDSKGENYKIEFQPFLFEEGLIYESITIIKEKERITLETNPVKFWEMINPLENKRAIKKRFERMLAAVKKHTPEALDNELDIPVTAGPNSYLIFLAVAALIITFFYHYYENIMEICN